MKKNLLIISFIIIFPTVVYAIENTYDGNFQPDVFIEKGYKPEKNNQTIKLDDNILHIEPVQQKPLPKSIREHKIDYNNNGRPDYMPYALKDILIEY